GATSWSSARLARFAIDGLMAFTTVPLRVWSYIGVLVSLGALAYGIYFLVKTWIIGADGPGYPSLIVAIMSFPGIPLISLGIIGEYLAQMASEVKRRPLFIVSELHGFEGRQKERDATVHRIDAAG